MTSFHNEKAVKAAKEHQCYLCHTPIEKGEKHISSAGKWDGQFYQSREHLWCREKFMTKVITDYDHDLEFCHHTGFMEYLWGLYKEWGIEEEMSVIRKLDAIYLTLKDLETTINVFDRKERLTHLNRLIHLFACEIKCYFLNTDDTRLFSGGMLVGKLLDIIAIRDEVVSCETR